MRLTIWIKLTAIAVLVFCTIGLASGGKAKKKSGASASPPVTCTKKCKSAEMCIVTAGKDTCTKAKPECAKPGATPTSVVRIDSARRPAKIYTFPSFAEKQGRGLQCTKIVGTKVFLIKE